MSEQSTPGPSAGVLKVPRSVEVIIDFNGLSLQSGPLTDPSAVSSQGDELFFDGRIWKVERVIKTLEASSSSTSTHLCSLLTKLYGKTMGDRLLSEMTVLEQTFTGASKMILAAPKLSASGGSLERFIYIKLSRPID